MAVLTSRYPVLTLDQRVLVSAGERLTPELLSELSEKGAGPADPPHPVLSFGTVRADLARLLAREPFSVIFGDPERGSGTWKLMERVRLPLPVLETLDYFKRYELYTYQHTLVIFALSTLLALELAGDSEEAEQVALAGPVHDIGRICIPPRILKKTTPLTRSERDRIEHHPLAGYVLLCHYLHDPAGRPARVAREHHERRDGSGYPLGISPPDRLVEIVAVCDVYDAMISSRPYRPASYENRAALEELTAMARRGLFREEIVRALIAVNRRKKTRPEECRVSLEKRGQSPGGNLYGVIVDDPSTDESPV
jgi:HD-GYP domain-containing protein (c-di-GMP phosphodiesterase class II)